MTVGELIKILREHPEDMFVEVEVYDKDRDLRLWGPLTNAEEESGEMSLFARHDGEPALR